MSRRRKRWAAALGPLAGPLTQVSDAGLELLRAEVGLVSSELKSSWRAFLKALFVLALGLFALFWAIGAVALVVLEVASLWMPRWAASLVVLGLFVLLGLTFALVARARLARIDRPDQTVQRRIEEHRAWWEQKVSAVRSSAGRAERAESPLDPET